MEIGPEAKASPAGHRKVVWIFLLAVPLLVDFLWKTIISPRPFWVFYSDPELIYYFQGVRLARKLLPTYVHSPGTPVVVLAAILRMLLGGDELEPARVLEAAHWIGLLAAFGGLWALLRGALDRVPAGIALAAAGVLFLHPAAFSYSTVLSAELFSLPVGCLLIVAVVRAGERVNSLPALAALGGMVGIACAFKMTFAAWVPAALIVAVAGWAATYRPLVGRLTVVTASGAGSFLLATLPVVPRYREMMGWYFGVLSHSGAYGSGEPSLPPIPVLLARLWSLFATAKAWNFVGFGALAAGCWFAWRQRKAMQGREHFILLAAFASTAAAGSLLYLKHPGAHYLYPVGMAITGLAVSAARMAGNDLPRWAPACAACAILVLATRAAVLDIRTHEARLEWGQVSEQTLDTIVTAGSSGESRDTVLLGWRFPTRAFAIGYFAHFVSGLDITAEFCQRFPGVGIYDAFSGRRWPMEASQHWDWLIVGPQVVGSHLPAEDLRRLENEAHAVGGWLVLRDP